MAQLISGLDPVYKRSRNSWQDTSAPPNVIINALGPGLTALSLQRYTDIGNQPYHRESMKGQVCDVPNLQFLFKTLAAQESQYKDLTFGQPTHRESLKGQVLDPQQNTLLSFSIFNAATARAVVYNPVYKRSQLIQDTTIHRNPVLDVVTAVLPFHPPLFENEQAYHRDSLSGQYGRNGPIVPLGVPPAFNELYTFVPRLRTAQEPFIFPNVVILGVAATAPPFVHQQSEDHQWRRPKTQETYQFPNSLIGLLHPVTSPQIHRQSEDLDWRGKKTQEPFVYPNILIRDLPPIIIYPFVRRQFEDLSRFTRVTQDPFLFPNLVSWQVAPLVLITLGEALQILATAGFTVYPLITWQYSTTIPYYYVMSQLPIGGSVILYQSQPVQLTVSAGPPPPTPAMVSVPTLTGMPLLVAMEIISADRLNLGTVAYEQSASVPINTVVAQSPAAGTSVEQYTSINLTVCSGPLQDTLIGDEYEVPTVTPTLQ